MQINKYILILVLSVVIASSSQVLLKKSAGKDHASIWKEYVNLYVAAGYGLFVVSTILTILALKGIQYKNIPVIEALGYVFIMLLSRWIFKEKITKKKLIGNVMIIIGIIVFYL